MADFKNSTCKILLKLKVKIHSKLTSHVKIRHIELEAEEKNGLKSKVHNVHNLRGILALGLGPPHHDHDHDMRGTVPLLRGSPLMSGFPVLK